VIVGADRLQGVKLLACLSPDEREAIAKRCAWRRFGAGETIIGRDDESRHIAWIVEGRARIVVVTAGGREVVYAEIGSGSHVGELAAIDEGPRSAEVVALEPCQVASLSPEEFRALLERHASVALELLRHLAGIVRLADLRITELSTMGAVHRVCRELLRRGHRRPSDNACVIEQLPTQEALAGLTGTTRETVARILAQLANAGLVRRQGRGTMILRDTRRIGELAGFEEPAGDLVT
jgi:CRP/FNR family transcriptional regulator, cyclic AMP receptor protein